MNPDTFDFEICVPVRTPIAAVGRGKADESPATTEARTVYHGAYEGLVVAWSEIDAWIAANGHTQGPDLWECFVAGPASNSGPAAWRTELSRRLIR